MSVNIYNKETKSCKEVANKTRTAIIDDAMSDTSDNLVKNKVIKKYVDDVNSEIQGDLLQLSNPNLLINPDFRVNTNGKTIYNTPGYAVDRWKITSNGSITVTNNGISISTNDTDFYMIQTLSNTELKGKRVTLTIKLSGTNSISQSATDDLFLETESFAMGYVVSEIDTTITVRVKNGHNVDIEWMKLELGSIATPFVPPNHNVEIYKCLGASGSYSNPNLLINPDFKINQRGGSEYTTPNTYSVDRWKIDSYNPCTVEIINDGIKIISPSDIYGRIVYYMEEPIKSDTYYTITVATNNGVSSHTFINSNYEGALLPNNIRFFFIEGNTIILECAANTEITINWVKLELGSIATPFVPRPYGEDLALCQRYGFECGIDDSVQGYPLTVQAATSNVAYGLLPIPVTMRTTPTISKQTLLYCFGTFNTGFSNTVQVHLSVMGFSNNTIQIAATIDDNLFIPGNVYTVYFPGSPKSLFFDAEIH